MTVFLEFVCSIINSDFILISRTSPSSFQNSASFSVFQDFLWTSIGFFVFSVKHLWSGNVQSFYPISWIHVRAHFSLDWCRSCCNFYFDRVACRIAAIYRFSTFFFVFYFRHVFSLKAFTLSTNFSCFFYFCFSSFILKASYVKNNTPVQAM